MLDDDLKNNVIKDVVLLKLVGFKPIIVHGGGKDISYWIDKIGGETKFINGLRYTFDHMGNTGNRCGYDMTGDDKQLDEYSPYIIRISFDNIEGESIVSALAEENVAIATGSACNSDSLLGSNVIRDYLTTSYNEIKDEDELQRYVNGTIRISYDHTLTIDQIQQFLVKLKKVLSFLLRTAAVHPLEKEK